MKLTLNQYETETMQTISQSAQKKHVTSCLRSTLTNIDIYAEPINLLFKKQDRYSTPIGSCISTCIIIVLVLSFIFLVVDLLHYNRPVVTTATNFTTNLDISDYLGSARFQLVVSLTNSLGLDIPSTVLSPSLLVFNEVGNQMTFESHQLISCSNPNALISDRSVLRESGSDSQFCLDSKQWNPKSSTFNSQLVIEPCYNTASSNECLPKSEIDAQLSLGGYLSISFLDTVYNERISGDPFTFQQAKNIYQFFQGSTSVITNIMKKITISDEYNFFEFSQDEKHHQGYSLERTDVQTRPFQSVLAVVNWSINNKSDYKIRSYETLLGVFAKIVGLMQFLIFVFGFVVRPMTRMSRNVALINQVFSFEDDQGAGSGGRILSQSIAQQQLIQSGFAGEKNQYQELKKLLAQKNKQLDIKGFKILTANCDNRCKDMIEFGVSRIKEQIDVTAILGKLFELEKLKRFLLNEDQLKLFEYIPKPVIKPQNSAAVRPLQRMKSGVIDYFYKDTPQDQKVYEALLSYISLKKSPETADMKLIDMLDQDIKNVFELAQLDPVQIPITLQKVQSDSLRNKEFEQDELEQKNDEEAISDRPELE